MYVQKVKIVGNCEKTTCELSKSYLKVYGRLNGRLVTSGGAAPVKQIKSQVFLSSYLFSGMSNEYVPGIHN